VWALAMHVPDLHRLWRSRVARLLLGPHRPKTPTRHPAGPRSLHFGRNPWVDKPLERQLRAVMRKLKPPGPWNSHREKRLILAHSR
jgi:hypothetical protein